MTLVLSPGPPEYSIKTDIEIEYCWDSALTSARKILNFMKEGNITSMLRRFRSPAADLWIQLELFIRAAGYEIQIEDYIPDPWDPERFTFVALISKN